MFNAVQMYSNMLNYAAYDDCLECRDADDWVKVPSLSDVHPSSHSARTLH